MAEIVLSLPLRSVPWRRGDLGNPRVAPIKPRAEETRAQAAGRSGAYADEIRMREPWSATRWFTATAVLQFFAALQELATPLRAGRPDAAWADPIWIQS